MSPPDSSFCADHTACMSKIARSEADIQKLFDLVDENAKAVNGIAVKVAMIVGGISAASLLIQLLLK